MIKAGFFQFNPVFGDIPRNVEKAVSLLSEHDADLVVLPELFSTGYQFISKEEVEGLSEEVPSGYSTQRLAKLSRDRNMYIVAGIAEKAGDAFYNSAVLTGPEGFIGVYRKTHLFYEERLWFSPGDTGFQVWDTQIGKIGIMICFDWFFPESARTLALKGADIIAHPSNLVLPYCPEAMITRCLENRIFAITSNRRGEEKRGGKEALKFIGSSEIVDPRGRIFYRASADKDEFFCADIDLEEARNKELNTFNNLFGDRRKEFYR